jgi:hypothetical protein
LQNTPLPLTEITQPTMSPTTSQDISQPTPKITKPDSSSTVDVPSSSQGIIQDNLKKAVRDSYNNGQNKLEFTTTSQPSSYEANDTLDVY